MQTHRADRRIEAGDCRTADKAKTLAGARIPAVLDGSSSASFGNRSFQIGLFGTNCQYALAAVMSEPGSFRGM